MPRERETAARRERETPARRERETPAPPRPGGAAGAARAASADPPAGAPDTRRVVIEGLAPCVDGGCFPIKRSRGETVTVEADIFADGHDALAAVLRHRAAGMAQWHEVPMEALPNDRWRAAFTVEALGRHEYTVSAWVDAFATWQHGLAKKVAAGQEVGSELLEGAALVRDGAARAAGADAAWLAEQAACLAEPGAVERIAVALAPALAAAMARHPDRRHASDAGVLAVTVERERAAAGAWYELFPRSTSPTLARHGTFADCAARLPDIAAMGFEVVYLPPIHPIGRVNRKGPNNQPGAGPDDLGSPWGIGAAEGGHDAVHPALGTLADFRALVAQARAHGLEIALDIAFQCAPDHPWVTAHPQWFRWRPDGTVQYAENPPKKYQDIYPLHFDTADWPALWEALRGVVLHWVAQGVHIFRVDNPHTKPLRFWQWLIAEVQRVDPSAIFLAEAFTRPKIMRYLAKAGFSQSYTYFTWRNAKAELTEYLSELTQPPVVDYLRPNLFANTPDILHAELQQGGRPAFARRAVLAATLGANYGIYGPAFELCEGRALPQSEEYLDSEKYQQRVWDLDHPDSLRPLLTRLNAARRANPALRQMRTLRFVPTDNPQLLAYAKHDADAANLVLTVVNLDPQYVQSGWLDLPVLDYGLPAEEPYEVHDLLSDARYTWRGGRNYVALDPAVQVAHVLRVAVPPAAPAEA